MKRKKPKSHDVFHQEWLFKRGLTLSQIKARRKGAVVAIPKYESMPDVLSNTVGNGFARRTVFDNFQNERPEVRDEIMRKASRTAPAYNKGNYVFITDGDDPSQIGSRSRRP